ncbi:LLM class flavin-dependent oxidoreductase [Gordonia liuliyuniae]|uniref:LLM class flavin-dependent oxidoreductase n=1 Tax=Gordonia liuliyuniae TaxID=2911517 RepID=A0ABS9IWQ9_9ACTN|nr:LLM class flavin-dependent oxidoreductase [Gordonia liuliyuniae]MCF8590003.1 LLM class flavin-dependent oxidoreductase [Gordonia liuliyuniae]
MRDPKILLNLARPRESHDPVDTAKRALRDGVDGVGFADSPRLFPDPVLTAARVLGATDAALSGPCVIGLGLHHPSVVAQSCATLAEQFPGRTLTAVARGESSLRNEGVPVPSLREYRGQLESLRARLGELAPASGPVLGAGSGPRTIAATAHALGGVLLDVGVSTSVVERAVETARAAASDVRCWLFLRAVVTSDDDQAQRAAAPILGSCAMRLVQSPDWYQLNPQTVPRVAVVATAHDYRKHGTAGAAGEREPDPAADALIRDRFLLTGAASDIEARLRPLADLGIEGVVLAGATGGIEANLAVTVAAVRAGLAPTRGDPAANTGRRRA